jgi:hypothetical protein
MCQLLQDYWRGLSSFLESKLTNLERLQQVVEKLSCAKNWAVFEYLISSNGQRQEMSDEHRISHVAKSHSATKGRQPPPSCSVDIALHATLSLHKF